ncbi:hypothetical protein PJWF_00082 [Achromobacter phage JWF]|uniref:hypothetical protein n=1 Tax=Achromobacter phage JWF TaxID=1589748 RepID=UPI000588E791|nr:hypothetical protein AXJ13_gp106 [Achromobacter phage JWF]AJD82975.1 hypothetical protein PJWF_00082 [Achromobacter phage JWF]
MALNKVQKKKFITDLMDSVKKQMLAAVDHMPEEWDGIELRHHIQRKFEDNKVAHEMRGNTGRGRAYANVVATNRKI